MAGIKKTKIELKRQREALVRFERYLPMLQLKKQQLQFELHAVAARIDVVTQQQAEIWSDLNRWVKLLSEQVQPDIGSLIHVREVKTRAGNIAGVEIPVYDDVVLDVDKIDLFETPFWYDDGLASLQKLIKIRVELDILERQRRLIAEELRVTTQRVNLFEKVKIPETRENIRGIRIFLGDEQTAAVARGKIAKSRAVEYEKEYAA